MRLQVTDAMGVFWSDLRHAVRVYSKSPASTFVAVLALALGIGVNASVFISLESIVLHPLPYPSLEKILTVSDNTEGANANAVPLTPAEFIDLRSQVHLFSRVAAYQPADDVVSEKQPERVSVCRVSSQFFDVLGMAPLRGRTIARQWIDGHPLRELVVSEGFWRSHLGGRDGFPVPLYLHGQQFSVVGVMPDQFDLPLGTQLWLPLELSSSDRRDRTTHSYSVLGLLGGNASQGQARSELLALAKRWQRDYPSTNDRRSLTTIPLREMTSDQVTNHFIVLLTIAATFVLLLACANVGNLQLARATIGEREAAVRLALGASVFRLARQLLAESILLAFGAGAIGLALAAWNNDLQRAAIPAETFRLVPGLRTMHVDATVAAGALIASLLAGVLCGMPTLVVQIRRFGKQGTIDALRGRGGSNSMPGSSRLRSWLVVGELALSLVLLVGAGLMVQTFRRMLTRDQGFDPKNVLQMRISFSEESTRNHAFTRAQLGRALDALESVPGVRSAGLTNTVGIADKLALEGRPALQAGEPKPEITTVSSGTQRALRLALVAGRWMDQRDGPDSAPVVVLSRSVANHFWPKGDPLGRRIKLSPDAPWLTVVGICGDQIEDWFTGVPALQVYVPYTQFPTTAATFLLRTAGDPGKAAGRARQVLASIDPQMPAYDVESLEQAMADQRAGVRAAAQNMTLYAVLALILASTGVFGVISYFVAARTHDIGVRMALGARRGQVLATVMRQSMGMLLFGIGIGLPLSIALAIVMRSALYGTVTLNAWTFVAFVSVLSATAFLASYLPCRRATRIDPLTALRNE